jgi:glutamate-1-semialdehyde 2,1-aminomutase
LLGYRDPVVEEAIRAQLEAGTILTLMHPVEVEVAALLVEMIPCAEMAAFGKNGSDVLTAAIRIARAATGRERVFQCGFHGFHDWYTGLAPGVRGIPSVLTSLTHPFPYNDLDSLERLFGRFAGEVAAVVMEPVTFELPEPGYLEAVRELAHHNGALLVFDELVTGFRLANGGGQELFRVLPDLACFGKALSNGMPLAAVVGRSEYMKLLPDVGYGMTARGETLSLAAARATLQALKKEPVAGRLARTGARVREALQRAADAHGVRCELLGPEARMCFYFHEELVSRARIQRLFLAECARQGVLTGGDILPTAAHDEEAVERTENAFDHALRRVSEVHGAARGAVVDAMEAGWSVSGSVSSNGGRPAGAFGGSLDLVAENGDHLDLKGWLLYGGEPVDAVEAVAEGGAVRRAVISERPDVAEAFPAIDGAARSGFELALDAPAFRAGGRYAFTLRAVRDEDEVFRCRVDRWQGGRSDAPPPHWSSEGTLYL